MRNPDFPHAVGRTVEALIVTPIHPNMQDLRKFRCERKQIFLLTAALGLVIGTLVGQAQELQPSKTELGWQGWDITINRLIFTNSVKQSFGARKTADSDSEFVYLSMTVRNASHEGQSFIPQNNLKIVIDDNTFDAEDIDSSFEYVKNIEPTLSRTRECYFELPKSAVKDSLLLRFTAFFTDTSDIPVSITSAAAPTAQPLVEPVPQRIPTTNAQPSGLLVRSPSPPYPAQALQAHISGIVHVRMTVQDGNIVNVEASGLPILANPAKRWVRSTWKFNPTANGTFTVPVSFVAH
jgi:hypothetical protein